ncbi:MAG: chromate transporter [Eubacteriales bacterium]
MIWLLFQIFFKIGMFTFGGGYVMIPIMQDQFINSLGWLTHDQFIDIIAIAEMTPGVIAVNMATFLGYKVSGSVFGGIASTFGVILPSSVIVCIITYYFSKFKHNMLIQDMFSFIRFGIPGIVASAAYGLLDNAVKDYFAIVIVLAAAYLSGIKKINPILIIIGASIVGIIIY